MTQKTKSQANKNDNAPIPPKPAKPSAEGQGGDADDRLTEWFLDVFLPQYGKQAGIAVAAIALGLILWFSWTGIQNKSELTANRQLGMAYVYMSQQKMDSAAVVLQAMLQEGPGGLAQAKAYLLLGKVRYSQARFEDAIKAYDNVKVSASKYPLIASGALHGLAASYMETKDYGQAVESLELFVKDFGKKSGDPEENLAGEEVVDPTPAVPNALWKLTLCYRELKDTAKAKATAEKLVRIYPDSREGADAVRLLAQL